VSGTLYGVGLGPGDPELVTVKAARIIGAAEVIAYHCARHGRSIARSVAEPYLVDGQIEERLMYPVTTETTDHPGGYQGAIDEFYAESARRLAAHLDAGRDVVVLSEGDPFFYGSYMHMHKRLAQQYKAVVVPGVTSISGAAAELGRPLVERDEVLTVLPGTLPEAELRRRIDDADSAVVMKLGRTFGPVRDALDSAGRLDDAWYVERATWQQQRIEPLSEVDADSVPYFAVAVLPSKVHQNPVPSTVDSSSTATGSVVVVGLGPAGREWTTPQAQNAVATADELIGYGPYLDRIAVNPRQRKHSSDNRVEAERAEFALDLAARGKRVAVISSGDPGVFAMAAAVLEVAEQTRYAGVEVTVLPGLTAAQAVASRVGAPLGHDYCVLSLSDRLKPWEIIERRLAAAAAADLAIAIYNPASKTRKQQLVRAKEVLLEHRDESTPVIIGRDVGGPAENVRVVPLGEFDPAEVDMRCLLLIGSSQTQWNEKTGVVFTPRHYPSPS
jgi:precorrin-2 C20-methyltransferase/precorrin-3B C17-methyltransferase